MDYSKKLQHPYWQKKRLEILSRDNFQCKLCGADYKELHVHHRWYVFGNEIWDYPDNCFETLCHECHAYVEMHLKDADHDIKLQLRRTYINQDDYGCFIGLLNHLSSDLYKDQDPVKISKAIDFIVENNFIDQIIKIELS